MIGYIYKTTNELNGKVYIGKHKATEYDSCYYGSGKLLCQAIRKYGIESFSNVILDVAETEEELNSKEMMYISEYKEKYGDGCYNLANGGEGGDVWKYVSQELKSEFVDKMTTINRERCACDDFKQKLSVATSKRYSSDAERELQRERQRRFWENNSEARLSQSERLKEIHERYRGKWNNGRHIPCVMQLNEEVIEFSSIKELRAYLHDVYNWNPDWYTIKKIVENSKHGIAYKPYHKNMLKSLDGLFIFLGCSSKQGVETKTDECMSVE